jgi:hypothetical protein
MPLSDYSHWNEEAERVWWEEEGKHAESEDSYATDAYVEALATERDNAFAEELGEMDDDDLDKLLKNEEYLARWPKAKPLIIWEINYRAAADWRQRDN